MLYCSRCIMPSTRPGLTLDDQGVCGACLWHESKAQIDWQTRRQELQEVAVWARREATGPWHCVVGVSGGKDSTWQALYVRDELGLNPLLVQFVCSDGTDLGRRNIENLVQQGFTLISVQPNPQVASALSRKSLFTYGNLLKYAEMALFPIPFRTAMEWDIPLVFFGENPALEAGDRSSNLAPWDASGIRFNNTLGGDKADIWLGDGVESRDLIQYRFPSNEALDAWGGKAIFMGWFLEWSGHDNAVFAINHGLECIDAPYRDIGVHYQHNSLDSDNAGIVNSMLKQIKLGFGNATEFACYDIRHGRLSRAEAIRLARDLDGRCDPRFVQAYCDWIGIPQSKFWEVANSFRGPMWQQSDKGEWSLRNPIWAQEPCHDEGSLEELIARVDTCRLTTPPGTTHTKPPRA